ncbi:MAG: hypothetical protein ABJM43_05190 [Paracoccaceae bacterium]
MSKYRKNPNFGSSQIAKLVQRSHYDGSPLLSGATLRLLLLWHEDNGNGNVGGGFNGNGNGNSDADVDLTAILPMEEFQSWQDFVPDWEGFFA